MRRRERQVEQIVTALDDGEYARVLVLSRQHLDEFPADAVVERAVETALANQARGGN